ncbi:unnamed protein product [Mortierella alpina]
MVRSTLLTLLVLTLIQVAFAVPLVRYLITNQAAQGALKGEPFEVLTVKRHDLKFEPWILERRPKGFVIATPNEYFVYPIKGEAVLTSFEYEWSLEETFKGLFTIRIPGENQVLSWDEDSEKVYIQHANRGEEQLWRIMALNLYGRMYL